MSEAASLSRFATRRNVLVGGLGLACCGLAFAGARETALEPLPDGALERLMPQTLGPWRAIRAGGVVLPPESELSDKTYNDVLVRVYENGAGGAIALLLAYGAFQGRDMQLHRPEVCYPAAGFAIKSTQVLGLSIPAQPLIAARLLDTQSQQRSEQVLYWTRVGQEFPTSPMEQRLAVVRQNLRGNVPDGILVRTSTVASDAQAALPTLRGFVDAMLEASPAATRRLLVGQA
jgi:EpsI family protein